MPFLFTPDDAVDDVLLCTSHPLLWHLFLQVPFAQPDRVTLALLLSPLEARVLVL